MPAYRQKTSEGWVSVHSVRGNVVEELSHHRPRPLLGYVPTLAEKWQPCPKCGGAMNGRKSDEEHCDACQERAERKEIAEKKKREEVLRRILATPVKMLARGEMVELPPEPKKNGKANFLPRPPIFDGFRRAVS